MAEGIKNSKHLQHGDIIALVCDGPLGYDRFLSSASSSVKEIGSDLRVSYEPSVQVEAGAFSPEFQSTSLWRVDSSTGESAPGKLSKSFVSIEVRAFLGHGYCSQRERAVNLHVRSCIRWLCR